MGWTHVLLLLLLAAAGDDSVYAPLSLYQGNWEVTPSNLAKGAKPDRLSNDCSRTGKFFACQQTVNGKPGPLIVFIPTETAGQYHTQVILPDGHATGRGDLEIKGDHWTYSGKAEEGGKVTYSRTTNQFTGKDRIHFEVAESSDGQQWTVKMSGDERRLP